VSHRRVRLGFDVEEPGQEFGVGQLLVGTSLHETLSRGGAVSLSVEATEAVAVLITIADI